MRCQQCGHNNPEDHKFCGMCGVKLEPAAPAITIDDNDPLDIEAPAYRFEERSFSAAPVTEFADRDRQRERTREASRNWASEHAVVSVKTFPPDTVQEEAVEEETRAEPNHASGIGGPSFLGLSYEGSNTGFVYDKPRDDGFVYDNDGQTPEYLLEDAPRRSSWRAWLLFFLLAAGAGLGFVQWRASHNQGPDLGSILAGNGATVDPNHPVVNPAAAKLAAKPNPPATTNAAAGDSDNDEAANNASDSNQDTDTATASSDAKSTKGPADASATSDSKTATPKSEDTDADETDSSASASPNNKVADMKSNDGATEPESDGPSKAAAHVKAKPAAVIEKPATPKPLGDKDPLIIEADKYIQGRGVRQNCSTGVNLLRQAISAGNPEADVKMGALYWSGTCVTQSNVTAYEWFARAHALEPRNRWIERSRNSLWASMSSSDRQRVSY